MRLNEAVVCKAVIQITICLSKWNLEEALKKKFFNDRICICDAISAVPYSHSHTVTFFKNKQ